MKSSLNTNILAALSAGAKTYFLQYFWIYLGYLVSNIENIIQA